jgi:hypothetical protein
MKKSSVFDGIGSSRKGEKMCKMTQEVRSQKRKCGQSMSLGALRLKTNGRRIECEWGNSALKGQRFADIPDIQCNVILLRDIPENDFQDCFRKWHHRLTKCIASQGENFKGDSSR